MEPTSSGSIGLATALKIYGLKAVLIFFFAACASIVAVAIVPPKSGNEAMRRIGVTLICSYIFGAPLLDYLQYTYDFVTRSFEPVVYFSAGLPSWWLLGGLARMGEKYGDSILNKLAKRFGLIDQD